MEKTLRIITKEHEFVILRAREICFCFRFPGLQLNRQVKLRGLLGRLGGLSRFSLYSISPSTFLLLPPHSFLPDPISSSFSEWCSHWWKRRVRIFQLSPGVPPFPPHRPPPREEAPEAAGTGRTGRTPVGGVVSQRPRPGWGGGEGSCSLPRPPAVATRRTGRRRWAAAGRDRGGAGAGLPGRAGLLRSTARPKIAQSVGQLARSSDPRTPRRSPLDADPRVHASRRPAGQWLATTYSCPLVLAAALDPPGALALWRPGPRRAQRGAPPGPRFRASWSPRRRRWPLPRKVRSGVVGIGGPGGGGGGGGGPRCPRWRLREGAALSRLEMDGAGLPRPWGWEVAGRRPLARREGQPRLALCCASLGRWPRAGAGGPVGNWAASFAAASARPPPPAPAHSRFCRGGNLPGPGGDSATAAFGPALPRAPAAGPGCVSGGGRWLRQASGAAMHLCGGEERRRGTGRPPGPWLPGVWIFSL